MKSGDVNWIVQGRVTAWVKGVSAQWGKGCCSPSLIPTAMVKGEDGLSVEQTEVVQVQYKART